MTGRDISHRLAEFMTVTRRAAADLHRFQISPLCNIDSRFWDIAIKGVVTGLHGDEPITLDAGVSIVAADCVGDREQCEEGGEV